MLFSFIVLFTIFGDSFIQCTMIVESIFTFTSLCRGCVMVTTPDFISEFESQSGHKRHNMEVQFTGFETEQTARGFHSWKKWPITSWFC